MKTIKKLMTLAAVLLCGGAWAATPLVEWCGDFNTTTKTDSSSRTYTINLNGNATIAQDGSAIVMNSAATRGVLINLSSTFVPATTPLTVMIRYENRAENQDSFMVGFNKDGSNVAGGMIANGGIMRAVNTNYGFYSASGRLSPESGAGKMYVTYSSSGLTANVFRGYGWDGKTQAHATDGCSAQAGVEIDSIAVGGPIGDSISPAKGAKITGIAIFSEASFDPNSYLFPDEIKYYNGNGSNGEHKEAAGDVFKFSIPASTTLPVGTKVMVDTVAIGLGSRNNTGNVPKYMKIGDVISNPVNNTGSAVTGTLMANSSHKEGYIFSGKGLILDVGTEYDVLFTTDGTSTFTTTKWWAITPQSGTTSALTYSIDGFSKQPTQEVFFHPVFAPAGYKIVGNQVVLDASAYSKWNNFNAIFTKISGPKFAYAKNNTRPDDIARMLDLSGGTESEIVMGTACAIPGHTGTPTPWKTFTKATNNQYVDPGHVLRIAPGSTATAASDQTDIAAGIKQVMEVDFPSLSLGGLIVERGAPVFKITGSGDRQTFFGDQRTSNGVTAYFDINENIVIARSHNSNDNSIKFFGDEIWTIADGKKVTLNASEEVEAKFPALDTVTHACVKVVGGGQFVVSTLKATGAVTLDLSAQKLARETSVIEGTVVMDSNTTLVLPSDMQVGEMLKVATAITGAPGIVKLGDTESLMPLKVTVADGVVTLAEAECVAKVGEKGYATIAEAFAALATSQSDVIEILADNQTYSTAFTATKNITIKVDEAKTFTMSAGVSGAADVKITKTGTGMLKLAAANSFAGTWQVDAGTLKGTVLGNSNRSTGVFGKGGEDGVTINVGVNGTLDFSNAVYGGHKVNLAGVLTCSESLNINSGWQFVNTLNVTDDHAQITGNKFGVIAAGAATAINLNGHPLTINMASATTPFYLNKTTINGSGTITVSQGVLTVANALTISEGSTVVLTANPALESTGSIVVDGSLTVPTALATTPTTTLQAAWVEKTIDQETGAVTYAATRLANPTRTWGTGLEGCYLSKDAQSPTYVFAGVTLAEIADGTYFIAATIDGDGNSFIQTPIAASYVLREAYDGGNTLKLQMQVYEGTYTKIQNVDLTQVEVEGVNYISAVGKEQRYGAKNSNTVGTLLTGGSIPSIANAFETVKMTLLQLSSPTLDWGTGTQTNNGNYLSQDAGSPSYIFAGVSVEDITGGKYNLTGQLWGTWINSQETSTQILTRNTSHRTQLDVQLQIYERSNTKYQNVTLVDTIAIDKHYLGVYTGEQGYKSGNSLASKTVLSNQNVQTKTDHHFETTKLTLVRNDPPRDDDGNVVEIDVPVQRDAQNNPIPYNTVQSNGL